MKRSIKTLVLVFGTGSAFLLGNCQKKDTNLKPLPPVDSAVLNNMRPVTQSLNNGGPTYVYNYEYDKNNNLFKYARTDGVVDYMIGTNQVDINVSEYASADHKLTHLSTTSFIYTLVGTNSNTSVNFFNTPPTQVKYTYFDKDVLSGVTKSRPGGLIQFENGKGGLPVKMISADGGGYNYNYTYDNKENLISAEFVRLSGPRVGEVYERISFTSFDDKPSPFSAVKGYWEASYPQGYTWEYALAFCKNNPTQIITEIFDTDKNAFVKYQEDDLTYVYNDKGYPAQISISTTYYTAIVTHYLTIYTYKYK